MPLNFQMRLSACNFELPSLKEVMINPNSPEVDLVYMCIKCKLPSILPVIGACTSSPPMAAISLAWQAEDFISGVASLWTLHSLPSLCRVGSTSSNVRS